MFVAATIKITIRDGRAGREGGEAGVTPDGKGAILEVVERDRPVQVGEIIKLPDGADGEVIGVEDDIVPGRSWEQTVHVGDVWPHSAD